MHIIIEFGLEVIPGHGKSEKVFVSKIKNREHCPIVERPKKKT